MDTKPTNENMSPPIELEAGDQDAVLQADERPLMAEPPKVWLVAVTDLVMPGEAGMDRELDRFYIEVLGFEREGENRPAGRQAKPLLGEPVSTLTAPPLVLGFHNQEEPPPKLPGSHHELGSSIPRSLPGYRAENFSLRFERIDPPPDRDSIRPVGIAVPSFAEVEARMIEAEVPFERIKGISPAQEVIMLRDPCGNWIELTERRTL